MRLYLIPDKDNIMNSLRLADKYSASFEFNDFYKPELLDDEKQVNKLVSFYKGYHLPSECHLHGAFFDITVFSEDPKIREVSDLRVEQSIDIAERLRCSAVIFHTNYIPNFQQTAYRDHWVDTNAEYWRKKLEKHDSIKIYIENMFDISPWLLRRLAEKMADNPRFGVCYDYAHAAIFGGSTDEWTRCLDNSVKHLHINDNDLVSDLHLPAGSGSLDWQEFARTLEKLPDDISMLIEVEDTENQQKSLDFLYSVEEISRHLPTKHG